MSNPASQKRQLREQLLHQRKQLPPETRRAAATAVARCAQRLPDWQHRQKVAIYFSANAELDTDPLITSCRQQGKTLYLPVIREDNGLDFALWRENDTLAKNRFNIPEPGTNAPRLGAASLDLVFMPLVGWDLTGHRLGMGGGFYDRALAGIDGPLRVGLAYDCQRVDHIAQEAWDESLDFVLTESALHRCGQDAKARELSPG